jgi:hypothetical protein
MTAATPLPPDNEPEATCKTCRWWDDTDGHAGICRRHSPRSVSEYDNPDHTLINPVSLWPVTYFDDWCGEHSAVSAETTAQKKNTVPREDVDKFVAAIAMAISRRGGSNYGPVRMLRDMRIACESMGFSFKAIEDASS